MNLFKNIATKVLSKKILVSSKQRIILAYHDVSDPDSPQYSELYSTTIDNFQKQIEFIGRDFEIVSLEEIVSPEFSSKRRLACVTFDDGFLSVKEKAMPFLSAREIPFAVFANSEAVKENQLAYSSKFSELNKKYDKKVYLDAADLKSLSENGVLIGNHSSSHKILSECDENEMRQEILDNKLFLEEIINKEVKHLALPYGKREHYNPAVLDLCFSTGHDYVYSSNPMYFNAADLSGERRLIPRFGIGNQSPEELSFMINRPLLKKIDI